MSNLKELIDQLYEEVTQQVPPDAAPTDDTATAEAVGLDTDRLRQILSQMNGILQDDDTNSYQTPAPLSAEAATRLIIQWENLVSNIAGLNRHISELDKDIVRMQPWGDFDVIKVNELRRHDCHVRFWTLPVSIFATQATAPWFIDHQATLVSQDTTDAYFITISLDPEAPQLPSTAKEVEICPCPVSTLIMLQSRDKDSLKRLLTLQGDFALAHYAELRETLRDIMPQGADLPHQKYSRRQYLKNRLKKMFHKKP